MMTGNRGSNSPEIKYQVGQQNMEDYKTKATNPQQYDSEELDWTIGGNIDSPSRIFFREYLHKHLENLKGKSVIDVGSGVGHLFPMLKELGASDIEGVEPSKRNVEYSRNLYSNIIIHEGTLQNFISEKLFDIVICIMAFEHILDVGNAFSHIVNIIKPGGRFYLIFGDKDFHILNQPPEIGVDVQEIGEGVVATKTIRRRENSTETMYDIFRPTQMFVSSGREFGFDLVKHVELTPLQGRDTLSWAGKPICHLIVLKRS